MATRAILTPQQERFCALYVENGRNGTQAAKDAGYGARSAHVRASKLLASPKIQGYLAELVIPAAAKAIEDLGKKEVEIAAREENIAAREENIAQAETLEQLRDRVRRQIINRLVAMGFTHMGQIADWTEEGVQFVPSAELTAEELASVASIESRVSEGESQDGKTLFKHVNMRVKQHNPYTAMRELTHLLELRPKKDAPAGKAEASAGVVVIVAGGPTGLELGARVAIVQPAAALPAVPATAQSEQTQPAEHAPTGEQLPGAMRKWTPGTKKKHGTQGTSPTPAVRSRAIVSRRPAQA
jgi:hypothetical protein